MTIYIYIAGLDQRNTPESARRALEILELDVQLREKRRIFLESRDASAYPEYLDTLLEGGFLHLYDYLFPIATSPGATPSRKEIRCFSAAEICRIVLDVRQAIIYHVKQLVKQGYQNVVFLVGNTGSGKSTTLSLLKGDPLERKNNCYEVPNQEIISHSLTTSHTLSISRGLMIREGIWLI